MINLLEASDLDSILSRLTSLEVSNLDLLNRIVALEGEVAPPPPPPPTTGVFEVGEGKQYLTLASVPWESLKPGDEVKLYYKNTPYKEKLLLSQSGTEALPIKFTGILGPNNEKPIIDGTNATTRANQPYVSISHQDRSVVQVSYRQGQSYGTKPKNIVISNIEFSGGYRENDTSPRTYVAADGSTRSYSFNATGLWIERGENITVQDCVFTNNGNGFFVSSGDEEALVSRNIKFLNCHSYDNGNVGRDREHNAYCAALGMIYENCTIGNLRAGAIGSGLKDRSAGTIIKGCNLQGGAIFLDLVDAEDSVHLVALDPLYRDTLVENCIFTNIHPDGATIVHYGGDTGVFSNYRKGKLTFRNNNLSIKADQAQRWRTILFRVDTNDESVDMENCNIVVTPSIVGQPKTNLCLMQANGILNILSGNFVTTGWAPFRDGVTITGTVNNASSITNT